MSTFWESWGYKTPGSWSLENVVCASVVALITKWKEAQMILHTTALLRYLLSFTFLMLVLFWYSSIFFVVKKNFIDILLSRTYSTYIQHIFPLCVTAHIAPKWSKSSLLKIYTIREMKLHTYCDYFCFVHIGADSAHWYIWENGV